ncbi:MAG: hypothetical protein MHM6MM_008634, partial [Cercozoa sp. M6MM]
MLLKTVALSLLLTVHASQSPTDELCADANNWIELHGCEIDGQTGQCMRTLICRYDAEQQLNLGCEAMACAGIGNSTTAAATTTTTTAATTSTTVNTSSDRRDAVANGQLQRRAFDLVDDLACAFVWETRCYDSILLEWSDEGSCGEACTALAVPCQASFCRARVQCVAQELEQASPKCGDVRSSVTLGKARPNEKVVDVNVELRCGFLWPVGCMDMSTNTFLPTDSQCVDCPDWAMACSPDKCLGDNGDDDPDP